MTDTETADVLAEGGGVTVSVLPPVGRFSLRCAPSDRPAIAKALGLALKEGIGDRAKRGKAESLCVGPDEWILRCSAALGMKKQAALAEIDALHPHSFVEISDREMTLRLDGAAASDLLAFGCPRDLNTMAVNTGFRSVFDGIGIILWRDDPEGFRLDVARSYFPYLLDRLKSGCAELEAAPGI
ncbi:MAG: sarcosine oxidase subunit gamma [Magnetospiraceae bacterium]